VCRKKETNEGQERREHAFRENGFQGVTEMVGESGEQRQNGPLRKKKKKRRAAGGKFQKGGAKRMDRKGGGDG